MTIGTTNDVLINCRPDGFYNMIISCSNSHNNLVITRLVLVLADGLNLAGNSLADYYSARTN